MNQEIVMTKRLPYMAKGWILSRSILAQNRWTGKIAGQVDVHGKHGYLNKSDKKDGTQCSDGRSGGKWGANLLSAASN